MEIFPYITRPSAARVSFNPCVWPPALAVPSGPRARADRLGAAQTGATAAATGAVWLVLLLRLTPLLEMVMVLVLRSLRVRRAERSWAVA